MGEKRGKGRSCAYCKRIMEATTSASKLAATRDHVVPKSKWTSADRIYGPRIVWCCRQCNLLKGHKMPVEWSQFMAENPEWWRQPKFQCGSLSRIPKPQMTAEQTIELLRTT